MDKNIIVNLVVPDEVSRELGVDPRQSLTWRTNHPQSSYGLGVLISPYQELLDGKSFRRLYSLGCRIETNDVVKVCGALGVPVGEPGVVGVDFAES